MNRVLVTGSNGMLGQHVSLALEGKGYEVIRHIRNEVDLRDHAKTQRFILTTKPDAIVHCAALVGGIKANVEGGKRFYFENYLIDHNVLTSAREADVNNLVYMGSSCMYPANREYELRVEDLMTGPLEPTNFDYAMAKLAGAQLVSSIAETDNVPWRNLIASNLYGPGDHFDSDRSHLLASIIHKSQVVLANSLDGIEMWGDGKPKREFTFVEDLALWIANAITILRELPTYLNVGFGQDYSVLQYYQFVLQAMNLNVEIKMDLSKPSGNSRKLMDSSVAKSFGWNPSTTIHEGINRTIDWYRQGLKT